MDASKGKFNSMVVGKFLNSREFEVEEIQDRVDSWVTKARIEVRKEGKYILFFCQNLEDSEDLMALYNTINFNSALLVLKPWRLEASFRSFNFSEAAMWVKVEGIPVALSSSSFAEQLLKKLGKVMLFDDKSNAPGPKRFLRVLLWLRLKAPFIPGAFIELHQGKTIWVDFRYEGVFNFCKRCGRIGHKQRWCIKPWEIAQQDVECAIVTACNQEACLMLGPNSAPLYSSKIYGLPFIPMFTTTTVRLDRWRTLSEIISSSSSSHSTDGDDKDEYDSKDDMDHDEKEEDNDR
ncbi:hypothetical protein BVRB_7g179640 [Beta vulgaris subsp. vulgaris]|uniref:Zinc knuckle CX2CX4HX4C domain-containing protein n=1 Tax=Beta vulgaris subsp. vulgaris TaxID=3555 RepID=A0A0J8BAQ7_BETVV|nr:hypothetical protein BVRB_7g179640 [Beta vulgaris subsp. vulgaris]